MSYSSTKWRINITANCGNDNLNCVEIEMFDTIGGVDLLTGGTFTYSSQYDSGTNAAANVIDNNWSSTHWSASGSTGWLAYEWSEAKTIIAYTVGASSMIATIASAKDWTLEAFIDGSWVVVDTQAEHTNWVDAERRMFIVGDTIFSPSNMSAASTPSPFVASASSQYSSTYAAWRAFNGLSQDIGSYWIGTGQGVDWLKLDIGDGNAKTLSGYIIQVNKIPEPNRASKNWTMEGSNDNSIWDTLDTVTDQTSWSSGQDRYFTCDTTSTAYRYFRLNITANNGDANYTQIGNLYLIYIPSVIDNTRSVWDVVSSTWMNVAELDVAVSGTINNIAEGWIVVSGEWKRFWPPPT